MKWMSKWMSVCLLATLPSGVWATGIVDGQLTPPPNAPRAVSSQVAPDHRAYIAPLVVQGDPNTYMRRLKTVVFALPRTELVTSTATYLHVTVSSRWMRFVDDVEFLMDPAAGVVHVRSAARIGYYDFQVNRERVEAIRLAMAAQ